jgi:hypothetical protein
MTRTKRIQRRMQRIGRKILDDAERSRPQATKMTTTASGRAAERARSVGRRVVQTGESLGRAGERELTRARERLRSTLPHRARAA